MRQQVRTGHAARDRAAWRGLLHHPLAAAAGLLDPGDLDHLHLGGDHIEEFADIFAHHTQIAATVGAAGTGIKLAALARGCIRDTWTSTQRGRRGLFRRPFILPLVDGCLITLGHRNQQVFERQFQLFDLALDLFRGFTESQFLEFGDPQTQGLNQLVVHTECGRYLGVFRL